MLRPTGITRRITLLAWSVSLATLAIFVSFIIPEQKRDLRIQLESQASGVAAALHGEIASAAITEDYSSVIDHGMQVLAQDPAVDFLVISKNDGYALVIARDSWRTEPDIDPYWRPGVRRSSGVIGSVPMFNQRLFHYSAPFDYNGIQWGWIHVGLSLESYDRSSRDVNERTGLLAIACVLLGLVASALLGRALCAAHPSSPGIVERVAHGDLTARSDIHSHDEIEQLAQVFNSMADAILHRDRELSEAKRDLEIRVTAHPAAERADCGHATRPTASWPRRRSVSSSSPASPAWRKSPPAFSTTWATCSTASTSPPHRWTSCANRESPS